MNPSTGVNVNTVDPRIKELRRDLEQFDSRCQAEFAYMRSEIRRVQDSFKIMDTPRAAPIANGNEEIGVSERMGKWFHELGCLSQFAFIAGSIFSLGLVTLGAWVYFACLGKPSQT